jgi:hypothetical protein
MTTIRTHEQALVDGLLLVGVVMAFLTGYAALLTL